jgi:FKBP-type peptidyl-prolyl cis-trans isomerase SlyD
VIYCKWNSTLQENQILALEPFCQKKVGIPAMAKNLGSKRIEKNMVVTLAYTLTIEGELIDSVEGGEPLIFIQGFGNIISGLEERLYGMYEGESKKMTIPAEEAYGEYDYDQIQPIPISEFPEDLVLTPGLELEMKDKNGEILFGKILSVGKSRVKMDFNHPLAGKALDFELSIIGLRKATKEELEQGYVS